MNCRAGVARRSEGPTVPGRLATKSERFVTYCTMVLPPHWQDEPEARRTCPVGLLLWPWSGGLGVQLSGEIDDLLEPGSEFGRHLLLIGDLQRLFQQTPKFEAGFGLGTDLRTR